MALEPTHTDNDQTFTTPSAPQRSRLVQYISFGLVVVVVAAIAFFAIGNKSTSSSSANGLSFAKLVAYDKASGACKGVTQTAEGSHVNAKAKADHINGVFSCETKEVLTFIDYFNTTKDREAITSAKGFISQAQCAAVRFKCGIDYASNWLWVGLIASKPKTALADETEVRADQLLMDPAKVNAKA